MLCSKYVKLWSKVKDQEAKQATEVMSGEPVQCGGGQNLMLSHYTEKKKDVGERDLFRLVVVNSYGSQEVRKLVDDPMRPLSLTGGVVRLCIVLMF